MSDEREERLTAWLDGVMTPEQAEAFEAELAADPELAAEARAWQANDALITAAFEPIAATPIEPDLLRKMGLAAAVSPVAATPLVANDNPPWWQRHALPIGGALAASLAIAMLWGPQTRQVQADGVSVALETTPAMKATRLADGRILQPTLTARAGNGQWCREYRIESEIALACRSSSGWQVEAQGKGGGPAQENGVALAQGADGSALDAAYRRLGIADPVGSAEEASLIGSGWGTR